MNFAGIPPVRCRQPAVGEWFRVLPGAEGGALAATLRDPETGLRYLVGEGVRPFLTRRVSMACFRTCINADGEIFIWRIPAEIDEGSPHAWRMSGETVAELAELKWCSVEIDQEQQRYIVTTDRPGMRDPSWPPVCLAALLYEAFDDRVITTLTHPLAIRKRGPR